MFYEKENPGILVGLLGKYLAKHLMTANTSLCTVGTDLKMALSAEAHILGVD
jgi:hypothetical protein